MKKTMFTISEEFPQIVERLFTIIVTFVTKVDVDIEALEAKKHKDLDEAIAITDVDPRYFSELDARLVREKFSVRKYVEDCREILKYRLLAGQQMDDCIRIDQQFVEEQKRLDKIKVFVLNQKKKKKEKITIRRSFRKIGKKLFIFIYNIYNYL